MLLNLQIHSLIEYSEKTLLERLVLTEKKFGKFLDGFEIYIFPEYSNKQHQKDKEKISQILSKYHVNTFHLVANQQFPFNKNSEWAEQCFQTMHYYNCKKLITRAVVHPDIFVDLDYLLQLSNKYSIKIGIEILGEDASTGNTFTTISNIMTQYKDFDLVADTAHIYEMTIRGEPPMDVYFKSFSNRLKHIHISAAGNFYNELNISEDIRTSHSLVSLKWKSLYQFIPIISRINNLLFTIEGVVPSGNFGKDLLLSEISFIRNCYKK